MAPSEEEWDTLTESEGVRLVELREEVARLKALAERLSSGDRRH